MLKITYSDSDLLVEQVALTVEVLVAQRTVVALRAGQPLLLQPGYGSFTLLAGLPGVEALTCAQWQGLIDLAPCDDNWLEVTLRGIWLADHLTSDEGILLAELGDTLERQLVALWRLSLGRVAAHLPNAH